MNIFVVATHYNFFNKTRKTNLDFSLNFCGTGEAHTKVTDVYDKSTTGQKRGSISHNVSEKERYDTQGNP